MTDQARRAVNVRALRIEENIDASEPDSRAAARLIITHFGEALRAELLAKHRQTPSTTHED